MFEWMEEWSIKNKKFNKLKKDVKTNIEKECIELQNYLDKQHLDGITLSNNKIIVPISHSDCNEIIWEVNKNTEQINFRNVKSDDKEVILFDYENNFFMKKDSNDDYTKKVDNIAEVVDIVFRRLLY